MNTPPISIADAIATLKLAFIKDPSYAYHWHSTVACSAMEAGQEPYAANETAARFMFTAFGLQLKDYKP